MVLVLLKKSDSLGSALVTQIVRILPAQHCSSSCLRLPLPPGLGRAASEALSLPVIYRTTVTGKVAF